MLLGQHLKIELDKDKAFSKVLIADDDLPTRMLLRAAIQQWGYEVIEACNGEQAWEILNGESPPVLLVIDWLMPKMDGIQLISRIKNELMFNSYIILLTQLTGAPNAVKALEIGADEFLTKPFNMAELKIRLNVGARILTYKNAVVAQQYQLELCMLSMCLPKKPFCEDLLIANHFDTKRLFEIYGDDHESMGNFIKVFVSSTLTLVNDVETAIAQNDNEEVKRIIHSMKGSLSTSGALQIFDLVIKTENAIDIDDSSLAILYINQIKSILLEIQEKNIGQNKKSNAITDKLILIVDDNIINLKLTQLILKNSGFSVLTALDANQALSIINESTPALILMDLQLPGMDGLELTHMIKSNPKTKHIIVVALTANAMKGDEEKALNSGCDLYITKPFDTKLLPKTVADLLKV